MKHTPPDHPEFNDISTSQNTILQVVSFINDRQAVADNTKKLEEIQQCLEGAEVKKSSTKFLLKSHLNAVSSCRVSNWQTIKGRTFFPFFRDMN
jgi:hypothetical protein